uniref:C-type lectin domain-containing protein n=1 Tax=Oryzias latipes TaxID=8090 RepID=A0A3B3IDF3_ORYLA
MERIQEFSKIKLPLESDFNVFFFVSATRPVPGRGSGGWGGRIKICRDSPFFCENSPGLCCVSVCGSQRHYVLIRSPKSWAAARIFCRENFTDLASFADMEEMQGALAAVQGRDGQEVWIGLSKGSTLRWHWSLTGRDLYGEGEENHFIWGTVTDNNCVTFKDGKLHMRSCEDPRGGHAHIACPPPDGGLFEA